jgi:hypothetical protein
MNFGKEKRREGGTTPLKALSLSYSPSPLGEVLLKDNKISSLNDRRGFALATESPVS